MASLVMVGFGWCSVLSRVSQAGYVESRDPPCDRFGPRIIAIGQYDNGQPVVQEAVDFGAKSRQRPAVVCVLVALNLSHKPAETVARRSVVSGFCICHRAPHLLAGGLCKDLIRIQGCVSLSQV